MGASELIKVLVSVDRDPEKPRDGNWILPRR